MSDTDKQASVEQVIQISLAELHPFKGYGSMPRGQPYQVRDEDPVMQQIVATVRERGVRQPGLVRPDPEGGYEIVSGHRRFRACDLAGLDTMPVIVRNLSNEEAVAELVQSNIQRENVLPSERAWAYKMYLEAAKRQGARTDLTSPQICRNLRRIFCGTSGRLFRGFQIHLVRPCALAGQHIFALDITLHQLCDSLLVAQVSDYDWHRINTS